MSYFTRLPDGTVDRLDRWRGRWHDDYQGKPGFHLPTVNPNLQKFFGTKNKFDPDTDKPILVPLCGKTVDLAWLRDEAGFDCVCGVEGIPRALEELRKESLPDLQKIEAKPQQNGQQGDISIWTTAGSDGTEEVGWFRTGPADTDAPGTCSSKGIVSVLCADFYEISPSLFGQGDGEKEGKPPFGAVYDRAALVAVPPSGREQYVAKLDSLLQPGGKILLVTLDRDTEEGPPFRIVPQTVHDLFNPLGYHVETVADQEPELKGKATREYVFVITKKIDEQAEIH